MNRKTNDLAYNLALSFVRFVEATIPSNGGDAWIWTTTDGQRLTCVEHVVAALQAGELAPLPGRVELPMEMTF